MTEELKLCPWPWCQGEARYVSGYGVRCLACDTGLPCTRAKAALLWNSRATSADTEMMDFLADPAQSVANVTLPRHIVERNVHSLRDAIAEAMAEWKLPESLKETPE